MYYNLIIQNAVIVDGSGRDAYVSDIGIAGDRIQKIGDLKQEKGIRVIDAQGKIVAPGFIEPHSHVDTTVLFHPSMETYLMQGVTTVVTGNCGQGMAPMGDEVYRLAVDADRKASAAASPSFFQSFPALFTEKSKIAPYLKEKFGIELDWHSFEEFNKKCESLPIDGNLVPLAGHSAIRNAVMGMDCKRTSTEEECQEMERLMRECMEQGAFGFSTGRDPTYEPSVYAEDEEIIRLLKIVKEYDGIFTSHTANFVNGEFNTMAGYEEFFRQVKAAGVRANVSHLQLLDDFADPEAAVKVAREQIAYLEARKAEGVDLSYDIIPVSDASFVLCPYLASVFAPFVRMTGTRERLAECFKADDFRQMVRTVIESGMLPSADTRYSDGIFGRFYITHHKSANNGNKEDKVCLHGRLISDIAKEKEMDPLDYAIQLLVEDPDTKCGMSFQACEEAYDILINHPMAMPCIDGSSTTKDVDYSLCEELPEYPAPFYYNGMARYLVHNGGTRFEDTIHQMTGFVAERFKIEKRGLIREGYFADLVILDREKLQSYENDWDERKYPDGFEYVIVNGVITIQDKQHTGTSAGRVLRKRITRKGNE